MKKLMNPRPLQSLILVPLFVLSSACPGKQDDTAALLIAAIASSGSNKKKTSDITPPSEVSVLKDNPGNTQVVLNWTDPTDTDFDHIEITWSPGGSSIQNVNAGVESFTATGLTNGTEYTFTVKAIVTTGDTSVGKSTTSTPRPAGDRATHTADGITFYMRYMHEKRSYKGAGDSAAFQVNSDYWIAETEVTYELWNAVRAWATTDAGGGVRADGGPLYAFANPGNQGANNTTTCSSPTGTNLHPVACINWRDAMVWTNALTEWYNAKNGTSHACAYTSDALYSIPIRSSEDGSFDTSVDYPNPGSVDDPHVNPDAKGFRLPTYEEWELAARYINDANNDGDIMDAGEYYPGVNISGDTSGSFTTSTQLGNFAWYGSNSSYSTHPVATRSPNALGLYDMSGNLFEWNFSWQQNNAGIYRAIRGGAWLYTSNTLITGSNGYSIAPYEELYTYGFRISRSE